jgi:hypothetical protein
MGGVQRSGSARAMISDNYDSILRLPVLVVHVHMLYKVDSEVLPDDN